eukprot:TRINITY_DN142_c0_g1_i2.p1 TRINITY_DN142_c0_g1~~TRINITY_DN142_c0_g1_i2.p1  ORF type:complete len:128 (-),score=33.46 TRINITY_DN142_c0_g1_i2:204-554(-)
MNTQHTIPPEGIYTHSTTQRDTLFKEEIKTVTEIAIQLKDEIHASVQSDTVDTLLREERYIGLTEIAIQLKDEIHASVQSDTVDTRLREACASLPLDIVDNQLKDEIHALSTIRYC